MATADLMSADAVRERAGWMLDLARNDALLSWRLDEARLPACADLVVETIRHNYPTLDIPFHARWRHFRANGRDLWAETIAATHWPSLDERLRAACDLAIVSVLLDAGSGPDWDFHEVATGLRIGRSEGLGLASLAMFRSGAFSAVPGSPLRVDAAALAAITPDVLTAGFQVSADNPLVGVDGRAALLRRLGESLASRFGPDARPGDLAVELGSEGHVAAPAILRAILDQLGPIWPDRPGAVPGCGDCWHHPLIGGAGDTAGAVPFHKLSQWLAYSLIEPLQAACVVVSDLDGLTGLPEYRNGGLLIDAGVVILRDATDADRTHDVGSVLVVEWRALTVALLDQLAPLIRDRLGFSAADFPLAKVLEGGTWSAGRRIARQMRPGGGPPLNIASDGTVF